MKVKEILVIVGLTTSGLLIFGFSMGFMVALKLSAMVLGAWLMFVGVGIVMGHISMMADESLEQARAERRGKGMAHTAFAAMDKKGEIEDMKKHGPVVEIY